MVLTGAGPQSTGSVAPAADPIALWVVPVPDLGGVARHVLDVTRAGIPGWRIVVLCPEGALSAALRDAGRPVLTAAFGPEAGLAESVRSLRRTIARLRPAVVHSHLSYADIVSAIAVGPRLGRRQRPMLVSTEHGIAPHKDLYDSSRLRAGVMTRAHAMRSRSCDALIAVCQSTRDVMRAKWGITAPITVVCNGVERTSIPQRPPGLRIASISRLAPEKGIDRLLDAFALVRAEHPQAHLTIAGAGPLDAELRARAARLGLDGSVTFPGHVDAAALLDASDVVVQLSHWENCSYTVLDACAAGLGVVATPVGGNPEILPASSLCTADDLTQLAERIVEQGRHPERRPGLSPQWPTVAAMAERIADVYAGGSR